MHFSLAASLIAIATAFVSIETAMAFDKKELEVPSCDIYIQNTFTPELRTEIGQMLLDKGYRLIGLPGETDLDFPITKSLTNDSLVLATPYFFPNRAWQIFGHYIDRCTARAEIRLVREGQPLLTLVGKTKKGL